MGRVGSRAVVAAAAVAGVLAACEPGGDPGLSRDSEAVPDTGPLPAYVDSTTSAMSLAFRRAARRALPGVVHVQVEANGRRTGTVEEGSGSGFVYREDGYILTNNHVVQSASRVTVVMQDRREFSARVVGRDPNTDVAVLQVDATGLPVLATGDSDPLDVGDWVVALGYPLQLGSTATAGIVSAKGRNLQILGGAEASAPIEHFIQTDAAINVGNSGGPLVDLEGRVVGINSAIASLTGFYSGYGFAIPINLAQRVADDLIRYGEVHRPRLGVALEDVDPADAEIYGLDCICGAEVIRVTDNTAAQRAGIQLGDVIRTMDGERVDRSGELLERLARLEPGRQIRLGLMRQGAGLEVSVELGEFEPSVPAARETPVPEETGLGRLGFAATELSAEFAARLGLGGGGVVVSQVDARHPAGRTRLQQGVVLESVNGTSVGSLDDLRRLAGAIRPGAAVSLVVRGLDGSRTIINYRTRS